MYLTRFLGATALASTLLVSSMAWAQTTPSGSPGDITNPGQTEADAAQARSTDDQAAEITVTGSRLARPNEIAGSPITTVTAAELGVTARTSIGDVLNDLPQLTSTFSQQNSTRFLGTAGLNLLNLRGLGTQRTLVLVNGRRHVGADILNNAVSPDTNTFPTDLVERVDLLTGASSAVYGSDALAGVVNFVLKQDFEGVQLRGQGAVSQYGDAGAYYTSVLAGKNFADGRGNIAVDLEYARQNSVYASSRDYLRQNNTFITVDTDTAGIAPGQTLINYDGIPDNQFLRDVRSATLSAGGLVTIAGAPRTASGSAFSNTLCGAGARDVVGRAFTCNYLFQSSGALAAQTGQRVGLAAGTAANPVGTAAGAFLGGNGDTRREGQLIQLQPQLDRYSANLIGHFEFSPAFVPFVEAKYVRTDTFGQGTSGPAFFTGSTLDAFYERPRLDNPYLSADARTTIANAILASGINPNSASGALLTDADRAAIANGSYRFILRKNLTDLGIRSEKARRETYRAVVGARGTFNDDWNYELSANYGEFKERTKVLGNLNQQRMLLALDAVRNPATGQIVCGAQLDATRANRIASTLGIDNPSILAADIAACQPVNPFGVGNISDAARNYVLTDTVSQGKITQLDISGFVAGDTSGFFNLPGGPLQFSIGGEYRRETAFYEQDPLVSAGYTFYNAIALFDPTSFEVKEAFGELKLPLLKDVTLIKELTVSGAGRVSDYKGSAGTVEAYNADVVYSPFEGVRFRAAYGRSVRAPNLSDLYSPQSQNFASVVDPCSAINIASGTQFRAANCAAAGIPTNYDYRYTQTLEIVSGGNPNLSVEKSDSYTYGVVIQPVQTPGLSLSVDYFNIKVNNVITAPSAQQIINSCYDTPQPSQQFCGLFQRVGAGQTGPNGEQEYRIVEGTLQQTLLNYAKLQVRGIDANLAYTRRVGNVRLSSQIIYTHQFQNDQFLDPTQPGFADTIRGEIGQPIDAVNWNIGADFGQFYTNVQMRYLSKMSVGAIENLTTFQGRPPQNADIYDINYYPEVFYLDLKLGVNINERSNFYFGIDNVTNRTPPLFSTGTGAGTGIYDAIGRRFYAGVTARF